MTYQSQNKQILAYLQKGNWVTGWDAVEYFDCYRLGARIFDLRKQGHKIKTTMTQSTINNQVSFAVYTLEG